MVASPATGFRTVTEVVRSTSPSSASAAATRVTSTERSGSDSGGRGPAARGFILTLAPGLLDLRGEPGDHLEQIADDPVVGHLEDGSVLVLVDRDDHLRGPHSRQMLDR